MASGDLESLLFEEFSGGWNIRDFEFDLDPNESPDTYNCSVDAKGSVGARLGYSASNGGTPPAAVIVAGYYSDLLGLNIWQAGTGTYTQGTHTANFSASVRTWGSSSPIAMVDFMDYVWAVHPSDGLYRSADGTTWSNVAAGPSGTTIAVWQNKLWIGGNTTNRSRLYLSAAGDGTTWPTTVDLRAKDDQTIRAVHASETEGLLVFKDESAYRVYDSGTGAYQTLDVRYGAPSHYAVTSADGLTYVVNQHGIFGTDGQSELSPIADKLRPLWDAAILNFAQTSKWCLGWKPPYIYVSVTFGGSQTTNNLALEYSPRDGSIMPHSCAAGVYVTYGEDNLKLLGSSPTVNGQVYVLYDAIGTDAGSSIVSRFQTAWVRPSGYEMCRFRELIARGSTANASGISIYARLDGSDDLRQLAGSYGFLYQESDDQTWGGGATWGDGSVWGPTSSFEKTAHLHSLGVGRDISIEIQMTTSETVSAPAILDTGSGVTRGAWHLSGLRLLYVPLGRSGR